ncbi:MAG: hypothetical protein ACYTE8_08095 [Planctomycetota bacterium]
MEGGGGNCGSWVQSSACWADAEPAVRQMRMLSASRVNANLEIIFLPLCLWPF